MDLCRPGYRPKRSPGQLPALRRICDAKTGADLRMTRRELVFGAAAAGAGGTALKYRIIDPHVHVWVHDPRYPWARETVRPPDRDATPEMLLQLMKANSVERTVLVQ